MCRAGWCRITGSGDRILRSTCDSAAKCTMASAALAIGRVHSCGIADVAAHEAITRVVCHRRQVLQVARVSQLVEIDDAPAGRGEHHADECGADKPAAAGYQNIFICAASPSRSRSRIVIGDAAFVLRIIKAVRQVDEQRRVGRRSLCSRAHPGGIRTCQGRSPPTYSVLRCAKSRRIRPQVHQRHLEHALRRRPAIGLVQMIVKGLDGAGIAQRGRDLRRLRRKIRAAGPRPMRCTSRK